MWCDVDMMLVHWCICYYCYDFCNNNNNTSICKAHNVSIRAESEAPTYWRRWQCQTCSSVLSSANTTAVFLDVVYPFFSIFLCAVCGSMVESFGCWICEQQATGSNPDLPAVECNPGKFLTHVPLSPSSINCCQPMGLAAGKVTIGLALHWSCITDINGSTPTGWRPRRRRWAPVYTL